MNPVPVQPPGVEQLATLINWLSWGVSVACIAGVLVVAALMALSHRRGSDGSEAVGKLGVVLAAAVVGSAAGPVVNALI